MESVMQEDSGVFVENSLLHTSVQLRYHHYSIQLLNPMHMIADHRQADRALHRIHCQVDYANTFIDMASLPESLPITAPVIIMTSWHSQLR